jgi:hypothetical protein
MAIPSSGEISMNLFNTDRNIASGTQIDLAAAGTAYAISYATDGSNDLQMAEFYGKSSQFWTATRSGTFTRNNCSAGYDASSVTFSKTYTSYISQANANSLASGDASFNSDGQAYANANGTCTLNLRATTSYGCASSAPNTGYINVSGFSGGSGAPYSWRYKLESDPDSSYSAWKSGTGTTGGILGNGAWMVQIRDSVGNTQNLYSFAISCDYPGITVSIDYGGSYNGNAYIRVYNMAGGSGTGFYWYLSSDPPGTQRANDTYALNLANGSYTPYFGDSRGLQASGNPITFNYPEPPNNLQVRFKSVNDGTAPSGTNGGCDIGTNITVEMPTGATFENASSFTNTIFGSYGTGNVGWLSYNGRYVPIGKYTSGNTVVPFGSRANCPTQVPAYGPVSPAEYQCNVYTKQQKYNDGNGGFTWVDVEYNSTYCGYVYYPEVYLGFDYDAQSSCSGVTTTYYIAPTDSSWRLATAFYLYANGTGSPPAGYYSDGAWIRYWDGTLGTPIKCDGSGGGGIV